MKILLLSDIHSSFEMLERILEKVEKADFDVLLIAGDLTQFKPTDAIRIDRILSEFTENCFAVHGNCDHEVILEGNYDSLKFIHGKSVEFNGYRIHGIGGSAITPFNTPSEYSASQMRSFMSNFRFGEKNILLSHCPPKGILDRTYSGLNVGCEAIRERIVEFDLILCGHVHECCGKANSPTLAVNPGPVMWGRFAIIDTENLEVSLMKL